MMYLIELMNARHMSRTDLSDLSGVPESTLRDILTGKAQLDRCEAATLYSIAEALDVSICKNLLLTNRQMTDIYLLLMPGDKPFKTKILSKQIGTARLSFASPEQMLDCLDITPGSVSVLGLMNDKAGKVRLLIDRDLLKDERFGCHPCINTSTLSFSTRDLIEKIIPAMGHEPTYVELPWSVEE